MGRLDHNWIGSFFNGYVLVFPDDTEWQVEAKISEKCDYLVAEEYPHVLEKDLSESQAVYHCRQTAGPEVGQEGIMKIRMQVPTKYPESMDPEERAKEAVTKLGPWTANEINNLTDLNEKGCSVTPKLLTWDRFQQSSEMLVPGGYVAILVMEKLPGVSLDSSFWKYDREKRDNVRAAFRIALTELFGNDASHSDKRLANIHYDEKNDKWYV
ncbi:hypothetical protein GX51_02647 [Blastomyces parvus]|uniref:Protein kinase domain-containing protein n=1 Tax=Blastomyces parvus TaxID=2060905 RepID=A0A2B7XAC7_9EURO|nr:hypothetical protein GX51_02647 [Blastomyces parvus]